MPPVQPPPIDETPDSLGDLGGLISQSDLAAAPHDQTDEADDASYVDLDATDTSQVALDVPDLDDPSDSDSELILVDDEDDDGVDDPPPATLAKPLPKAFRVANPNSMAGAVSGLPPRLEFASKEEKDKIDAKAAAEQLARNEAYRKQMHEQRMHAVSNISTQGSRALAILVGLILLLVLLKGN